jgi:hypothetical protein
MPHIRRGWGLISPGTQHPGMEHEVTVIKGRRVPTFRHCKGISFELVNAAIRQRASVAARSAPVPHAECSRGKSPLPPSCCVQPLDRPTYLPATSGAANLVTHTVKPITAATASSSKTIIHPGDERRSVKGGGVMVHGVYSEERGLNGADQMPILLV